MCMVLLSISNMCDGAPMDGITDLKVFDCLVRS